jgi:hypothetical protein
MRQVIRKNEKKNTAGDTRFNMKFSSNTREKKPWRPTSKTPLYRGVFTNTVGYHGSDKP